MIPSFESVHEELEKLEVDEARVLTDKIYAEALVVLADMSAHGIDRDMYYNDAKFREASLTAVRGSICRTAVRNFHF